MDLVQSNSDGVQSNQNMHVAEPVLREESRSAVNMPLPEAVRLAKPATIAQQTNFRNLIAEAYPNKRKRTALAVRSIPLLVPAHLLPLPRTGSRSEAVRASVTRDVVSYLLPRQLARAAATIAVSRRLPVDVSYRTAEKADIAVRPLRLPDSLLPRLSEDAHAAAESRLGFVEITRVFDLAVGEALVAHIEQVAVSLFAGGRGCGCGGCDGDKLRLATAAERGEGIGSSVCRQAVDVAESALAQSRLLVAGDGLVHAAGGQHRETGEAVAGERTILDANGSLSGDRMAGPGRPPWRKRAGAVHRDVVKHPVKGIAAHGTDAGGQVARKLAKSNVSEAILAVVAVGCEGTVAASLSQCGRCGVLVICEVDRCLAPILFEYRTVLRDVHVGLEEARGCALIGLEHVLVRESRRHYLHGARERAWLGGRRDEQCGLFWKVVHAVGEERSVSEALLWLRVRQVDICPGGGHRSVLFAAGVRAHPGGVVVVVLLGVHVVRLCIEALLVVWVVWVVVGGGRTPVCQLGLQEVAEGGVR
jgi:hypothetical protein